MDPGRYLFKFPPRDHPPPHAVNLCAVLVVVRRVTWLNFTTDDRQQTDACQRSSLALFCSAFFFLLNPRFQPQFSPNSACKHLNLPKEKL